MNFPKPRIIDIIEVVTAVEAGCDCVMIKHDGWPVLINCAREVGSVFSALGDGLTDRLDGFQPVEPLDALLVGAKNRTNPTIYLYDTWWMDGNDVQHLSYRERYVLTRLNAKKLDDRFQPVTVHPIGFAQSLWTSVVQNQYKGLVFRRSKDPSAGELYVIRHYVEQPRALV